MPHIRSQIFALAALAIGLIGVGGSGVARADKLFDAAYADDANAAVRAGPGPSTQPAWARQDRQGVTALESAGRGENLSFDLKAKSGEPITLVIEYGFRGGRGPGELTADLMDDGGKKLRVTMRQDAGDKYTIDLLEGKAAKPQQLATLADATLDAGVQSGGVANSPATVSLHIDPNGKQFTLRRLGGKSATAKLPTAFAPTKLMLTDTSAGDEQPRLGRVRAFDGAVDPTTNPVAFSMPFGASFIEGREPPLVRVEGRWFSDEDRAVELSLKCTQDPLAADDGATPIDATLKATLHPGAIEELPAAALANLPAGLYALGGQLKVGSVATPIDAHFAILSKTLADRPQKDIPQWMGMVTAINILPHTVYPESFDYMRKIGVRHVRWLPGWGRLEPEKDQYQWDESDEFMDLVAKNHMQAMFCLSYYGGDWTSRLRNGTLARTPAGREMWVDRFAIPVMKRYGDRVKLFQIWNEPDAFWNEDPDKSTGFATPFGTPQNYFDLVKRTYEAKQKLGLKDVHVMASLSSGQIPRNTNVLLDLGLKKIFDGMIIHTYGNHPRHFTLLRQQLKKAGINNPLLGSGETGLPRSDGDPMSDLRQAVKVVNVLFSSTTIEAPVCVEWFVLHDGVAGGNFGLLDGNLQPHASATAYATAARLLAGAPIDKISGSLEDRGALNIYRVNRKNMPPVTAVSNSASPTLIEFAVAGSGQPVVWDVFGRSSEPKVENGTFRIQVSSAVMIEGDVSVKSAMVPSTAITLDKAGKPSLKIGVGKGNGDGQATVRIADLNFEQTQKLNDAGSVTIPLPDTFEQNKIYNARLDLSIRGVSMTQDIPIDLCPIYKVTEADAKSLTPPKRLPSITITGEEMFRPFSGRRSYIGPQDASATIQLGWTDTQFVLWAQEQDDVLFAIPPQVPNPFGYDSGQWSFQPDGDLTAGAPLTEIVFGQFTGKAGPNSAGEAMARVLGQPHIKPTILADRKGTVTRYRVTIPASQLGITPSVGVSLGMAVNLNDNDGDGRKGWIYWGNGINGQKNPMLHRRVVLEEKLRAK